MKSLYTKNKFDEVKSRTKLPLQCKQCHKTFYIAKNKIQEILKGNTNRTGDFCSKKCGQQYKYRNSTHIIICKQCSKQFKTNNAELKRKSINHFCSHICNGIYQSQHRKYGTSRSKLEKWLELQLITLYPNLRIIFNNSELINSELDIYIPSLKLAFELNGVFHYEPIFGIEKLNKTQSNDNRKMLACSEKCVSLCVIDTTKQKYFKEKTSYQYLNIITNIIDERGARDRI